jgi:hypothetical protein
MSLIAARTRSSSGLFRWVFASVALALTLTACEGDTRTTEELPADNTGNGPDLGSTPGNGPAMPATGEAGVDISNGFYTLSTSNSTVNLTEGTGAVSVALSLRREPGHDLPVTLAADGPTASDSRQLTWSFSDEQLDSGETSADLLLQLDYDVAPILSGTRTLQLTATDGSNAPVVFDLTLNITPTNRPDLYLLVGQSNMVGYSQVDARASAPGELDEPNARIKQLNVTGTGLPNFASPSDFTNVDSLAASNPRYPLALDPLHDGFDVSINGKAALRIGPALTFAKAALQNTEAEIVLIPAAWEDTGFCRRSTNQFEKLGWLAADTNNDAFAGTLLHDRAIARANLAIQETDGILRGILWHQGEADSDNATCAAAYAENLRAMVSSLRSSIARDARGAAGRGPSAEIPFIVGTMSKGSDARGSQAPFNDIKSIVDAAHRNVADIVPFSAFVNADDLVPPNYPCGEGSCIHFGAAALREAGTRYYERMQDLLSSRQ